ncbi:hypothetical protein CCACVL1_08253 [Corchorus capsularis]|uniref:Uncharacterized protein n=1 Tax=Corchorus capsularis TaxID=210143 RepID=A0A1R3J1I7_COCAP|nr:hypothetical protein CCACVL1_08253 [Corchorus capsularis]
MVRLVSAALARLLRPLLSSLNAVAIDAPLPSTPPLFLFFFPTSFLSELYPSNFNLHALFFSEQRRRHHQFRPPLSSRIPPGCCNLQNNKLSGLIPSELGSWDSGWDSSKVAEIAFFQLRSKQPQPQPTPRRNQNQDTRDGGAVKNVWIEIWERTGNMPKIFCTSYRGSTVEFSLLSLVVSSTSTYVRIPEEVPTRRSVGEFDREKLSTRLAFAVASIWTRVLSAVFSPLHFSGVSSMAAVVSHR